MIDSRASRCGPRPTRLQVYKGAQLGAAAPRHARGRAAARAGGLRPDRRRRPPGQRHRAATTSCCSTCAASSPTTRGAATPAATIEVNAKLLHAQRPAVVAARTLPAGAAGREHRPVPDVVAPRSSSRWARSASESPAGRWSAATAPRSASVAGSRARVDRAGRRTPYRPRRRTDPPERQVDPLARPAARCAAARAGSCAGCRRAITSRLPCGNSSASLQPRLARDASARSAASRPGSARRSPAAARVRPRRRCASPCSRGRRGSRLASTLLKSTPSSRASRSRTGRSAGGQGRGSKRVPE